MAVNFNISELKLIAEQLTDKLGLPFKLMTHSFLKRRLNEVFDKQGFKKTEHLVERLNDKLFCDDLCLQFSVDTTELFRDAGFWRYLRKSIAERSGDEGLHFWLPDLSSGDELYSLLILLNEINYADNARIHVNHPSLKALNDVKSGLLAARKMDTNSYNYKRFEGIAKLEDYYRESNQGFKMDSKLLNKVVFNQAGMLHAPAQKVDIILFRNSMLYYTKAYHYELKNTFDTALQAGGLICLGVKEILPEPFGDRFECLEQKEKIYGKYSFIKD